MDRPMLSCVKPSHAHPGERVSFRVENCPDPANNLTIVAINVIVPLVNGSVDLTIVNKNGKDSSMVITVGQDPKVEANKSVTYWPEHERSNCPAIIISKGKGIATGISAETDIEAIHSATGISREELDPLEGMQPYAGHGYNSGSISLISDNFDPKCFVLSAFRTKSFDSLKRSLHNFKVPSQHDKPLSVLKNNISAIVECHETLGRLVKTINGLKPNPDASLDRLLTQLSQCLSISKSQYKDALSKHTDGNKIRSCLRILNKHKVIFSLPKDLRKKIDDGLYEQCIGDYQRITSNYQATPVKTFQKCLQDANSVMDKFKGKLRTQLSSMPIEFSRARELIRFLRLVAPVEQPAWHCLENFKEWLIDRLRSITNDCLAASLDGVRPKPGQAGSSDTRDPLMGPASPPTVILMQAMCDLLSKHMVHFWHLGFDTVANTTPSKTNDQERKQWHQMSTDVVDHLCDVVNQCLIQKGNRDCEVLSVKSTPVDFNAVDRLPECIQLFRKCCMGLPQSVIPISSSQALGQLSNNLRKHALFETFVVAHRSILQLQRKELWHVRVTDTRGVFTELPNLYEDIMHNTLTGCSTLTARVGDWEKEIFELEEVNDQFPAWCFDAMSAFCTVLENLCSDIEKTGQQLRSDGMPSEDELVDTEARGLLVLLNNCLQSSSLSNARLLETYTSFNFANSGELWPNLQGEWQQKIKRLTAAYVETRANWILQQVTADLMIYYEGTVVNLATKLRPFHCSEIQGAETYVVVLATALAKVHAELLLYLGLKSIEPSQFEFRQPRIIAILSAVIEGVVDGFSKQLDKLEYSRWPRLCQLQVTFDLNLLRYLIPDVVRSEDTNSKLDSMHIKKNGGTIEAEENEILREVMETEVTEFNMLINGFAQFNRQIQLSSQVLEKSTSNINPRLRVRR